MRVTYGSGDRKHRDGSRWLATAGPRLSGFKLPSWLAPSEPAPESVESGCPRPEDFASLPPITAEDLAEAEHEAVEERRAILEADGLAGDPKPATSPGRWLVELNRRMGRENPPGLLEALEATEGETPERIGPSVPTPAWEPDRDDEAARLALLHDPPEVSITTQSNTQKATPRTHNNTHKTTGELDRLDHLMSAAGFVRVDEAELDRFIELDPPAAPRPETTKPKPRPKRSPGARTSPTFFEELPT